MNKVGNKTTPKTRNKHSIHNQNKPSHLARFMGVNSIQNQLVEREGRHKKREHEHATNFKRYISHALISSETCSMSPHTLILSHLLGKRVWRPVEVNRSTRRQILRTELKAPCTRRSVGGVEECERLRPKRQSPPETWQHSNKMNSQSPC